MKKSKTQQPKIMSSQKDLFPYIGEPGMDHVIATLTETDHIRKYYQTRIGCMCALMSGRGVTYKQQEAYMNKID